MGFEESLKGLEKGWPYNMLTSLSTTTDWAYSCSLKDVSAIFDSLDDDEKELLYLRYRDHLTYKAVGERTGRNIPQSRAAIFKAVQKLKRKYTKMKKEGI